MTERAVAIAMAGIMLGAAPRIAQAAADLDTRYGVAVPVPNGFQRVSIATAVAEEPGDK